MLPQHSDIEIAWYASIQQEPNGWKTVTTQFYIQEFSEYIAPLQDAVDLEIATEEERSLLEAWKKVSGAAKPCGHFRSTRYRVAYSTIINSMYIIGY